MDDADLTDLSSSRRKLDFGVHDENKDKELDNNTPKKSIIERHSIMSEEYVPKIDMEFETEELAYNFYKEYARMSGFSIRRHHVHKDANGRIIDRVFCCSCEGQRKKDKRDICIKKHRPETRTNCRASMTVNSRRNGRYKIVSFVAEHHGHDLVSPAKTHMLRSHRCVTKLQALQADNIESVGIAPKAGFELMATQRGGRENVGFILEDYKNYLRSKRTREMQVGDTGGIFEYLQKKQLSDPNFFYAIQVDEDDCIANILWVDGRMKYDYAHFGDVVSFDTTYKKNKEGRPFALFVGVNHHKQTIIFGAALLYDETADTFIWLFDTFAKAMHGKFPRTILTDQDAAMAKALTLQWPETTHRLCIWHIYKNAAIHLSSVFGRFPSFLREFSSCVYDYEEEEEFLDAWNIMLEKYELQENEWLRRLFNIREKWALVYGRQTFCADLITTQCSESMNGTLKRYVSYKHSLLQFFHHFDRLVDDRRYQELKADLTTSYSRQVHVIPVQILKHASSIYTPEVFELFKNEFSKAFDSKIEVCSEIEEIFEYKVTPFGKHYQHKVVYASLQDTISCSCKKFEFAGILCLHALKVLSFRNIWKIPDLYIMKRWTKEAKKNVVDMKCVEVDARSSRVVDKDEEIHMQGVWYKELCDLTCQFATRASLTEDTFKMAKNGILNMIEEVEKGLENIAFVKPTRQPVENASSDSRLHKLQSNDAFDGTQKELDRDGCISNAIVVRGWKKKETKQVPTGKRMRSGLEKSVQKRKPKQNKPKHAIQPPEDINKILFFLFSFYINTLLLVFTKYVHLS